MSTKDSLTQIFTTKEFPKEYAGLFAYLHRFAETQNPNSTKADLLAEAIYDLAIKTHGKKLTAKILKDLRDELNIPQPTVSIQAKLEIDSKF